MQRGKIPQSDPFSASSKGIVKDLLNFLHTGNFRKFDQLEPFSKIRGFTGTVENLLVKFT